MTGTALLLFALAMVAAAADWIAVDQGTAMEAVEGGRRSAGNQLVEYVAKPLTLVLLVAAALAIDPAETDVRMWFVAALVLSLIGDVFLMAPQDLFVPGLASFLLGHVAYIVGFVVAGMDPSRFGIGLVLVALAITVIGLRVLQAVRAGDEPELQTPVLAYMLVISAMVACAIGTGNPVAVLGAVLFYASDSLIAWNRFVGPTRRGRLAVITTYHLAQGALVLSLL